MRKKIVTIAMLLFITLILPVYTDEIDWRLTRSIITTVRLINTNIVQSISDTTRSAINSDGLEKLISDSQAGNGIEKTYNGNASYLVFKQGSFTPTSGIASGHAFKYVMTIKSKADDTYKLKFYFNDIDDIYGKETLTLVDVHYFSSSTLMIEVMTYTDTNSNNTLKIALSDPNFGIPPDGASNVRIRVQDTGSTIVVGMFSCWYNLSSKNYHTIAYIAKKDSPNYSIALRGLTLAGHIPSNNGGYLSNVNYGHFFNDNGTGVLVGDSNTDDSDANYPTIAEVEDVFASMTADTAYFNAGATSDSDGISSTDFAIDVNDSTKYPH